MMTGPDNIEEEAGATDNRLSLSVGDFPAIKGFEDGSRYTLTVTVEQQSPGEFSVVEVKPQGEVESAEPEEPADEESESEPAGGNQYPNPAINRMMRQGPRA